MDKTSTATNIAGDEADASPLKRRVRRMGAARARWHELVIKEALGTITPTEAKKLDRYQALVRPKRTAGEIHAEEVASWKVRNLLKTIKRLTREAVNSPNDQAQAAPTENSTSK